MAPERQNGFTLIEMIVVIVITGIIAGAVAVFIQRPVQGYIDSARRAELTDIADTALRRISRDLRLALPNSIRVSADGKTVELLLTRTGGRYRAAPKADGSGDVLDFSTSDNAFDIIGPALTFKTGDRVVVYNLGPNVPDADAYHGTNITTLDGTGGVLSTVPISGFKFPLESPGHRFQVVEKAVSYYCDTTSHTLWRFEGYAIQASQPDPATLSGGARLATYLDSCSISYLSNTTERSGLVTMLLTLKQENETVTLVQEVHVSNVP